MELHCGNLLYTRVAIIGRDAPRSVLFSGFVTAERMADICDIATCNPVHVSDARRRIKVTARIKRRVTSRTQKYYVCILSCNCKTDFYSELFNKLYVTMTTLFLRYICSLFNIAALTIIKSKLNEI